MAFSGFPGMPSAEQGQADKDKKIEALEREALQEAWKRNAFNKAYFAKHPDWNPMADAWTNISHPEHNKQVGADEVSEFAADGFGLSDENGVRIYPAGIYHYGEPEDYKKGKEFNILLDANGMVTTIPRKGFVSLSGGFDSQAFRASFEATVDFLVGTQGARTISLNLPCGAGGADSAWRRDYNRQQLKNMIKVAHDRGVAVHYDADTMGFIQALSPKDQERFLRARDLLQVNSEKANMMIGENYKEGFDEKTVEFNAKEKLATGATLDDFRAKIYGQPPVDTVEKKLESIDAHLKDVEARLKAVNNVAETLAGALSAQEKILQDPSELRRGAIMRAADPKNPEKNKIGLRKRAWHKIVGKERVTRFEDPDKVVDNIESRHNDSKMSRTALIGSVENEIKHLEETEKFLRQELAALKADPTATDAQKLEIDKQLKQVEKLKTDLEPGQKDIKKAAEKNRAMPTTIQQAREQVEKKKNDAQVRNAPTA